MSLVSFVKKTAFKVKRLLTPKQTITFHMKSGKSVVFKAYGIAITKQGNVLTGYAIDGGGCSGVHFTSLAEIEAITYK